MVALSTKLIAQRANFEQVAEAFGERAVELAAQLDTAEHQLTELAASAAEVDRLWTALKRSANAMDFAYEQLERHELEQTRLGSKAGRILSELRSCFAVIRPVLTAPPSEEQGKEVES